MVFYHGTSRGGLTELKPFYSEGSNLKEACVYLSTSRRVALFYIWDYARDPVRRMMMDIQPDKVVFQEMFPGALERFYKGGQRLYLPLRGGLRDAGRPRGKDLRHLPGAGAGGRGRGGGGRVPGNPEIPGKGGACV